MTGPPLYSKNVTFIVPDYSVDNGSENFVLIMMRKDHDEIESGLGLEPARIKKLSKIQQGCVVYTWKKFRKTDVILDGKLIASAQNNFRKLSRERAFDNLLRSQYRIVLIKEHYVSGVEEFVLKYTSSSTINHAERHVGFQEMGFGDDGKFFNLTVCFTLQMKNFLENFISQNSNDILVFSNDLSWKQKNIVCKLAHSLNLDATKIGQRPDTRVHVKQIKCSTKLMDLFWIMYQVLEEEDDYLIFQGPFIPKSMFDKLRDTIHENERKILDYLKEKNKLDFEIHIVQEIEHNGSILANFSTTNKKK
ncbi:hypothetical protein DAPPUDRAFT_326212 [Daphnia pulex]|uniref:Uncharacterized protein n=1 Tax=Daphnia pulex TaxID=6669 RepID=E9H6V9_DAPPU|nr:hypothetical protein DAPPUDRAFT_326212 [Daphnia pulex]|eukprot:EFX72468.1 hypothetical protein DAPPUDRAFT_326212 [Daphnia pulex]